MATKIFSPELISRFADIVGAANALTGTDDKAPYLREWRDRYTGKTPVVLRPRTTDEVSRILALAHDEGIGIVAQGGNTGLVGGQIPSPAGDQIVLSLTRMKKVRDVDAAAGAGFGLALACDLRVGCPSTFFTTAFIKIGLPGDFGVTWQLRDLLGAGQTTRLMLLSERVGADEALSLGLLNRLVPDDEVAATARGIAGQLAGSSAQAIGAMKANLREARHLDPAAAMDAELVRYRACADGDEHKAAVRAFAARSASTGQR